MSQLNIFERAKEICIKINGNTRTVIDVWFRGKKIWPIQESDPELIVDKTNINLNKRNRFLNFINVFTSKNNNWEFENNS